MRATDSAALVPYPYRLARGVALAPIEVDTRPLIHGIVSDLSKGVATATIARRFHVSLAAALCELCCVLRAETGLARVVLAGGVFANTLLVQDLEQRLGQAEFEIYRAHAYPTGDGGLSLGQLAIAAARDRQEN